MSHVLLLPGLVWVVR